MLQEPKLHRVASFAIAAIALATLLPPAAAAQTASGVRRAPDVQAAFACYVPGSGTIYRIRATRAPERCVDAGHIEFSLGGGSTGEMAAGGGKPPADHGSLGGLLDDDHPQYLPASGTRNSTGFAAISGAGDASPIPVTGAGKRLMWYPGKSAFRVGGTSGAAWDDGNIGLESFGAGYNPVASGRNSVAFGRNTTAAGDYAVAFGHVAQAHGEGSFASGTEAVATGNYSVAIGNRVWASGSSAVGIGYDLQANGAGSTTLGTYAQSDGKSGTFVFGDRSVNYHVRPAADNQFVVRAQRLWFGTHSIATATAGRFLETSTGAFLSTGGTWTNSSDVNRKEAFAPVDGESVLTRLAGLPLQTWNYRDEDPSVRHLGPTAQDFRAAFQLGDSETAIATVDADGVALVAAQALAKRTDALTAVVKQQGEEIKLLRSLVEELRRNSAGAGR